MSSRRFRHRQPPARRPLPPPFETTAEKLVYGGKALARAPDGRVAFVSGALPGERVAAIPCTDRKSYIECETGEILSPSPDRIPSCAPGVPGCVYAELAYQAETAAKKSQLAEAVARAMRSARIDSPAPEIVAHPSPNPLHYRNKAVMHAACGANGANILGYRSEPAHRVVDLPECPLSRPEINEALKTVRRDFLPRMRPGGDVVFRCTERDGATWFADGFPPRTEFLTETTAGIDFKVPARGFYQVNPETGAMLVDAVVREFARGGFAEVLDLYCGVGVFGLACAIAARKAGLPAPAVRGAEVATASAECARENAAALQVRAEFRACATAAALRGAAPGPGSFVVADPPRGGFEPGVAEALAACGAARLACVSCDPATLARDLAPLLRTRRIVSVDMFDMFPRTARFEALVVLA